MRYWIGMVFTVGFIMGVEAEPEVGGDSSWYDAHRDLVVVGAAVVWPLTLGAFAGYITEDIHHKLHHERQYP